MPSPSEGVRPVPGEHYFDVEFVQNVRQGLRQLGTDLVVAEEDRQRLFETDPPDDWFIRRFLAWRPTTVPVAIKTMIDVLAWRKEIDINHWKDTDFPQEFYQVAACFRYLPDIEDKNILILRLRSNRKDPVGLPALESLARNFIIHVVEQIVSQNPNRGFAIIFDCWKASLANVDISLARFIINILSNYYSGAISYVYIYELPWILNQIWRMIRSWLDDEAKQMVRFVTLDNINEYISIDNRPEYMNGTGTKDYRFIPKGVSTLEDMAQQLGIKSEKDLKRVNEHFQKLIKMA